MGKTAAVVEGLAQRIVAGDVPEVLKPKRIMRVPWTSLPQGRRHQVHAVNSKIA